MKKTVSMLLVITICVSLFSGVGFADGDKIIDEFGNEVIETPIEIEHTVKSVKISDDNELEKSIGDTKPNDFDLRVHEHYIENIKTTRINTFIPLTSYVLNDQYENESTWPKVTYARGESFQISASVNTSVGVDTDLVKAELGSEVGVSKTYTASQQYSFAVPYGYKGRIVYRYSYDYYTFDCVKEWWNGAKETGEGDASSAPIGGASSYYAIQKVYAF